MHVLESTFSGGDMRMFICIEEKQLTTERMSESESERDKHDKEVPRCRLSRTKIGTSIFLSPVSPIRARTGLEKLFFTFEPKKGNEPGSRLF